MATRDEIDGSGDDPVVRWLRRYPPVLSMFGALVLTIAALPSSLHDPQPAATDTLRFAPVPPEVEEAPPPPEGNVEVLGPGRQRAPSGGVGDGGGVNDAASTAPTGPPLPATGANPSTKHCVGVPPRQTEDPLSPPCVAFFEGDNFGPTYRGVTAEEIRVLVYLDGRLAETGGSRGYEPRPTARYFDLFEPPDEDGEHTMVTAFRVWQQYFNDRFQTYGRRAHFHLYFSGPGQTPKDRRADAADNFGVVEPFAVVSYDAGQNEDAYLEAMARRGVLNFGAFSGRTEEFFQSFAGLIWSRDPSVEQQVGNFLSYVCAKVIDRPVALSGNPGENDGPRKIGVVHTSDPAWPGLVSIADQVKAGVKDCGGEIAATATYDHCCYAQDNSRTPTYAQIQMAEFDRDGITTILHLGGLEGYYGPAAEALGYRPEWVVLGTGLLDANDPVRRARYSTSFDGRAVVVTPQTFQPALGHQLCYQAFRSVDRDFPDADMHFVCDAYDDLFQLFVGIQVAGPRLGPTSIDKGFHAIPAIRSPDPRVPACFYLPNDYTCVKDAQAKIWDASGQAPSEAAPGCWRAVEDGHRHLAGEWPPGNTDAQLTGDEPCDGRTSTSLVYTNPT